MPLYDILNEFQSGSSHMAAVVKAIGKSKTVPPMIDGEKSKENKTNCENSNLTVPLLPRPDEKQESVIVDVDRSSRSSNLSRIASSQRNDASANGLAYAYASEDIEGGEVIGIITLEDVFEELLQEEIVDETDEYVDVHKSIHVAAAVAASSVARAPSSWRLIAQKGAAGNQSGQGLTLKKSADSELISTKKPPSESHLLRKR